ncbi:MAG: hypothetical protein ACLT98_10355 [Eggerthellaceae bacterium]
MKVSLKWLSDYVDVPSDIKEFCDRLDLTGTGVEGVETLGATFDGVVVGYVKRARSILIATTCTWSRLTWAAKSLFKSCAALPISPRASRFP